MPSLIPILGAASAVLLVVGMLAALAPLALGKALVGMTAAGLLVWKTRWLIIIWALLGMFGNIRVGEQSIFGALSYASLPALLIVLILRLPTTARRHPWILVWLAFVVLVFANDLRSPLGIYEALRNSIGYLVTLGVAVLIVTEITTVRDANRLIAVILAGSSCVAAFAWYQFFSEVGGYNEGGGVYRTFSVYAWSNTLGFFLIMPVGLAACALVTSKGHIARVCAAASLTILVGGLFFTFGRAAWISTMISISGPLFLSTSFKKSSFSIVCSSLVVWMLLSNIDIDLSNRLSDPANYIGREIVRDIGIRLAMEMPIYGHGSFSANALFDSTHDTLLSLGFHNMYVLTFYEFGILGLVLFMLTWVAFLLECVRRFPNADAYERQVMMSAISILIGVLVFSWAGNDLVNFAPAMYLWIVLAWASASQGHCQSASPGAAPLDAQPSPPTQLVSSSPHGFALRPSESRRMATPSTRVWNGADDAALRDVEP